MTQVDLGFQAGPEQVIGTDRRVLGGRRAAAHRVSESARNRGGDYPFPANSTRPLDATGRMAAGYEGFFRADALTSPAQRNVDGRLSSTTHPVSPTSAIGIDRTLGRFSDRFAATDAY